MLSPRGGNRFCPGPANDFMIEQVWTFYIPKDESEVFVCTGSNFLRPTEGEIRVVQGSGEGRGGAVFLLPGEGVIQITDAPVGEAVPLSLLNDARLGIQTESGHRGVVRLIDGNLSRTRVTVAGESRVREP